MFHINAKLIKIVEVMPKYYKIVLSCPQFARIAEPGQFMNIKVSRGIEPFLRRPFSIHRVKGPDIEIIFEVVGKGTQLLSRRKAGELLDIIGPLGNGFSVSGSRLAVLAAGGIGVAPLFFLAEQLMRKPQTANRKPLVLIGSKKGSEVLCEKEFKDLGCEVKIATDDGSKGFKGKVTDLLKSILVSRLTSHV